MPKSLKEVRHDLMQAAVDLYEVTRKDKELLQDELDWFLEQGISTCPRIERALRLSQLYKKLLEIESAITNELENEVYGGK